MMKNKSKEFRKLIKFKKTRVNLDAWWMGKFLINQVAKEIQNLKIFKKKKRT